MRRSNPDMLRYSRRLKLPFRAEYETAVCSAAGLYNAAMFDYWRIWRNHGVQAPAQKCLMVLHCAAPGLHSHSCDAVVADFYDDLMSWGKRKRTDPRARPPMTRKTWHPVKYGKTHCIRLRGGDLQLSNGRTGTPFIVKNWKHSIPKQAILRRCADGFELVCIYEHLKPPAKPARGDVAGIDLGIVVMCGVKTQDDAYLLSSKVLRSLQHRQRKTARRFNVLIDATEPGSRRRKRLEQARDRQLKRFRDKNRDVIEKQTTKLVSQLDADGVSMLAIGDVRDIRRDTACGANLNSRLHQWPAGKVRRRLQQKAAARGMSTVLVSERYTTQTCPACGDRNKCKGREYCCATCGAVFHRDIVGAIGIRSRHVIGSLRGSVSAAKAQPRGLRYVPSARCSLLCNGK